MKISPGNCFFQFQLLVVLQLNTFYSAEARQFSRAPFSDWVLVIEDTGKIEALKKGTSHSLYLPIAQHKQAPPLRRKVYGNLSVHLLCIVVLILLGA